MDLDRFSKKLGVFASQTAKKAGDQVQIAKLGMDKAGIEKEMDDVYLAMGRHCYSRFKAGDPLSVQIREYCDAIDTCKAQISLLESEIAQRKADRDSAEYATPAEPAASSSEPSGAEPNE